ncbi:MAG: hypothetical protein DRR19_07155 [Candidatus Parabeggiatoa sp. nov. 1]|nr:MAG: hypothetical protein DRR19_07155 [Gammaproteobacteria bacterium]
MAQGQSAFSLPAENPSYDIEVCAPNYQCQTMHLETSGGQRIDETISLTPLQQQPATIQFIEQPKITVSENDSVISVAVVERTGRFDNAISVHYETSDGTAIAPHDYTPTNGTLNWEPGNQQAKPIEISIPDDTDFEPSDKTFKLTLTLSNPTSDTILGLHQIEVTIQDDDEPKPGRFQFSSTHYSVNESGVAELTVSRVDGHYGDVSVTYTSSNGTANAGSDYSRAEGRLFWFNGESQPQTFYVPIHSDHLTEGNETFTLTLSNPTGSANLGPATAVTIIDVPPPSPPPVLKHGKLLFANANHRINENGGIITFEVARIEGSDGEVSVEVNATADSTATLNRDFHIEGNPRLNWADGDSSPKPLTLVINDDQDWEGNETVALRLVNATGGATIGEPQQTQLTIVDNEQAPLPPQPPIINHGKLQFSAAAIKPINEGEGAITLEVNRVNGNDGSVSVEIIATADSTATLDSDFYLKTRHPLQWTDGDSNAKTLTLTILDDLTPEPAEKIILRLFSSMGDTILGEPNRVELTIIDNDEPRGTFAFYEHVYKVSAEQSLVPITITREEGSYGEVSVNWVASNGAQGTLSWQNGENQPKSVDIPTHHSSDFFTVMLSNATGGASLGVLNQAVLMIEPMPVTLVETETIVETITIVEKPPGTLQFPFSAY